MSTMHEFLRSLVKRRRNTKNWDRQQEQSYATWEPVKENCAWLVEYKRKGVAYSIAHLL